MKFDKRLKKAEVLHVGGSIADSIASLCLYSHDIDIKEISRLLECEPTEAHRRGDLLGKSKKQAAPSGLWSLTAPRELPFEEKLRFLVERTNNDKKVWNKLKISHRIHLRCAIFLHHWTEGVEIHSDLITEIGNRHWNLGLSVYSAEGEEILEAFLEPELSKYKSKIKKFSE